MQRARWLAALCGVGAAACTVARAQTTQATQAEEPAPQRVEIKAEPLSDTDLRRRDPVAKSVYGREELDRYGDVSVSDVLKRLPGVNLQGGNPRLRGLGASYTLVLINGEPAPPGFSLENLPPSQVERIEITKGPTAEFSAQAVAGTINIILREVPRQRQRELRLALGYTVARVVPSVSGTWADRWGDVGVSLPASAYQWQGGARSFGDYVSRDQLLQPQHTQVRALGRWQGGGVSFGPRLNWKVGDAWTFDALSFLQRNESRSQSQAQVDLLSGSVPRSVDERSSNHGSWQLARASLQAVRRWPGGERLEAKLGAQMSTNRYANRTLGLNAEGEQTLDRRGSGSTQERSASLSGKHTRPLFEAHSLLLGWDIEQRRREDVRSVFENGQPQLSGVEGEPFRARVQRAAFFVQDEWELAPRWAASVGLRAERIATSSEGVDASAGAGAGLTGNRDVRNTSTVVTPLLHVNHRLDAAGRDLLRASLTRSYRAPELAALLARPSINSTFPVSGPNPELAPDRVGNPALKAELSTGLDMAYEKYLSGGGVFSAGVFYRRIQGVVRNAVTLETVPWASVPRWVSRPVNLANARSAGLEFELKGQATELLPAAWAPEGLNLRASLSVYRSHVGRLPGPNNRLEQQQPWSATLGFDQRVAGTPLGFGANLSHTPAYLVQQTTAQVFEQGAARSADAYLLWAFSKETALRLSVNNLAAPDNVTLTRLTDSEAYEQRTGLRREARASYNASLSLKF